MSTNKIEVQAMPDGWIVIDVRQGIVVTCADERLDFHGSYDGQTWFDLRESRLFDIYQEVFDEQPKHPIDSYGCSYMRMRIAR